MKRKHETSEERERFLRKGEILEPAMALPPLQKGNVPITGNLTQFPSQSYKFVDLKN